MVSTPSLKDIGRDQYAAALQKHKDAWTEAGMSMTVFETMTPVTADNIRRGSPGRDEELRNWRGESTYSLATEFAEKGKVQFVHFRGLGGHGRDALSRDLP